MDNVRAEKVSISYDVEWTCPECGAWNIFDAVCPHDGKKDKCTGCGEIFYIEYEYQEFIEE